MPVSHRIDDNVVTIHLVGVQTAHWFEQRARASSRLCAFVTRPGLQYGLARMMAAWIEYKGYRAFVTTNPQQAVEWLQART